MTETNKRIARRIHEEVWSKGQLDLLDDLYAADFVDHTTTRRSASGIEGLKRSIAGYRRAFPDSVSTVEDQVAEGDLVVTRWTSTGTHQGEFADTPATGKRFTIDGTTTERFANGRVVERWATFDQLGLYHQLGIPPR